MVNIFCPFRRKYVAATPEENVRQTFLHALVEQFGYPQSLIGVEVPIAVGAGVDKRCDAVVYSRSLQPLMLIEFKAPEVEREPTLKIVSYNVGLFAHGNMGDKRLVLADSIAAYLRRTDADIICLQEFYLPNTLNMDAWFRDRFPGYKAEYYVLTGEKGHAGNVTLSRRPVLYKGKIDFEKSTNLALHTDIQLDSTVLRFYNCHFESYNISLSGLVKSIGHRDENVVEDTGNKMRRSITQRPKQVEEVIKDIDACPVRSVVLGDFNDNPLSYTVHRLLRGRKDAFVQAGKGFGATFRTFWPLLRIDYILCPRDLQAVSYEVPKVKYSDHYPVIATYYETR